MPAAEFEVVFLVTSDADVPELLSAVLHHRPNLRIEYVDDPADVAAWRDQLAGESPWASPPARRCSLVPSTNSPASPPRTNSTLSPVAWWVDGGRSRPKLSRDEPESSPRMADGLVWLVRTDRASRTEVGRLVPPVDAHCGSIGDYPVAVRHDGSAPDLETSTDTALSWVDGRLQVSTTLDRAVTAARFVLQHSGTLESRVVLATVQAADDSTLATISTSIVGEIAPWTAAGGDRLESGPWVVRLEVADEEDTWSVFEVGLAAVRPALIRSVGVVVTAADRLTVDVGPLGRPLLPLPEATAAQIVESVRGSVLSLPLPGLHCFETEGLDGQLFLNKMAVPARIELDDGVAELRAWVSGVAGDQALAVRFGRSPWQALKLTLRIDGLGAMSVIPTPPPPAKPAAAPKKPTTKAPAKKTSAEETMAKRKRRRSRRRPQGPLAKLRRAVPEPIEPFVRRLARVPALKKLYRRATRG